MNARDYKTFRAGCVYHVYNRGDNKEPVFLDEQDYVNFLKRLKICMGLASVPNAGRRGALTLRPLPSGSFSVFAYCLMSNHFHLLIRQNADIPIGVLMIKVCTSYARYFNKKYDRLGNLFQDTYKAKLVDTDRYVMYVSAYIHNNPAEPFSYLYSSMQDYLGLRGGIICDQSFILEYFDGSRDAYKKFVSGFSGKDHPAIKGLLFDE